MKALNEEIVSKLDGMLRKYKSVDSFDAFVTNYYESSQKTNTEMNERID